MKRIALLCALALFTLGLIPSGAHAQIFCEEENVFGLFFDSAASTINLNGVGAYSQYYMYLYLLNPNPDCLRGFEVEIIPPSDTLVLSKVFPPNSLNIGVDMSFIVGLQYPLISHDNRILLCTMVFLNTSSAGEVQDYYLSPTTPSSMEGNMVVLDCTETIRPAFPISLDYALPVARVNGEVPLQYCGGTGIDGLTVQISSQGDDENLAGTSSWANDGFDVAFDLVDPNPNPVVYFPHPEWNAPGGENFQQDIKEIYDPYNETKVWSFTVNSDIPDGFDPPYMVEVAFLPSFAGDDGINLTLVDLATDEITLLEDPYIHTYPIYALESRTFEMSVGYEEIIPQVPDLDIGVTVFCNDLADIGNHAAASDWATDGFDPGIDIPEPGPAPGNYLTAAFTNAGWPYGPRFRTMVHATYDPVTEMKSWPLRVETDQVGLVELVFDPSFDETSDFTLLIKDQQSGQVFSLFPDLTFTYENENPSVRDFLIVVGNQGPPELSPAQRGIYPGWSLVGHPLVPVPGQDSLAETILNQVSGLSYMYRHLGEDGYELEEPLDTAVHGRGYWLAVNEVFGWSMEGEISLEPVSLPMAQGWNLIGYPLWFPGAMENVQVEHLNKTYSWEQATSDGLVLGSVMGFNIGTDQYEVVQDLETWNGYWYGILEEDVSLVFDWENFMTIPSRISSPDRREYSPENIWTTALKVTDSQGNHHEVSFGVHPDATAEFDAVLDIPVVPPGPENTGSAGMMHPEWDMPLGNKLFRDLVAPESYPLAWNTEILAAGSGSVTLQWDRENWPDNLDLQIYLPQTNRVVLQSMRSQNSLRLAAPQGYLVVQFRTPNMSAADDLPAYATGLSIHPNPFNPQTTIAFELNREAETEVRIYSVRGEMIAVLQAGATGPGRHEVLWNGRDRQGREVPSGSYFARLYADGKAMGSVSKMSLVR